MPTKKSASLETLGYYIRYMTKRMDLLLGFAQRKLFRRLRLRSFIFMKRKLRQLCLMLAREGERTVVGFGDWSNQDVAGIIKKSPAGPVKRFERELARYCTVISIAEFRTSKVHFDCERELKNQYSQRLCWDGEIRTQKFWVPLRSSPPVSSAMGKKDTTEEERREVVSYLRDKSFDGKLKRGS
ncbi:hypothetical protein BBJ28_00018582, partial [Nothophytophthora sp. Chile5]